jgi:NADPH-dependent F420 reductase
MKQNFTPVILPRMRIGILGATGPAGRGLAARLASVGHEVLFGSRAVDKARAAVDELEKEWGDRVAGRLIACDNAWACDAPVVILAVHAESAIPTIQEHAERLPGKIVVSMANNLVKHGNEFNAVLPPHGSVAAEIQSLLWRSRVTTAFHLVPAAEFGALDHEMESDVVVLGDEDEAKITVMDIISSIPVLRPLDGGSLRNAVGMETFAAVLLTVNIRHKMRASLRLQSV